MKIKEKSFCSPCEKVYHRRNYKSYRQTKNKE